VFGEGRTVLYILIELTERGGLQNLHLQGGDNASTSYRICVCGGGGGCRTVADPGFDLRGVKKKQKNISILGLKKS